MRPSLNPPPPPQHPAWHGNALPSAPGVMLSYLIVGVLFLSYKYEKK